MLEPGDLLFVPSGTPHRVRNLDDTVAVSGNYIDSSNWCQAMKACLVQVGDVNVIIFASV